MGWAAFVIATFPNKFEFMHGVPAALFLCLTRDGSSFLLTLALRKIYRRFWSDHGDRMTTLIIVACSLASILQNGLFFVLRDILPLDAELFRIPGVAFSVFYERMGLLYGWSFLYFGMRHALQDRQRRLELALARNAQQGAELQMLRAQMNPHFLFNALNMIQTEVVKINPALGRMIQSLADFLRFSLDHTQDELVSLEKEFEAARDYLEVEKIRLGEKLDFHCAIDEEVRGVAVPGIILQPLVENAVKYGLNTSESPLRIRIVIRRRVSRLEIIVSNTGHWLEPAPRHKESHLGLQNLRRRLELLYPSKYRLDTAAQEGWVTIAIEIPLYELEKKRPNRR